MQQIFDAVLNFGNIMIIVGRAIMDFNATLTAAFPLLGLIKWATVIISGIAIIKKFASKHCRL